MIIISIAVDPSSASLRTGYLDDDTLIDVIYVSRFSDSVRRLRGLGDRTFTESEILPTDPDPIVVAAGDVSGDGSHDVVSGNSPPNGCGDVCTR
jgi:hypothetical protein